VPLTQKAGTYYFFVYAKRRLDRQRGAKVAHVEIARNLAEAIWCMLTRSQPFAPAGPARPLVA
jgi:transposase